MIVFDKAYNHYYQFAGWTAEEVNFVCRLKDNAVYEVVETMFEKTLTEEEAGVMKEEHIHIKYKDVKEEKPEKEKAKKKKQSVKTLCLRKVTYQDEQGRIFQFITNNFHITSGEVAFLYKKRWSIELVFKKLKRNFQLRYFYSETENGIRTQVWCTLIAHLLLMVLKNKDGNKESVFNRSCFDTNPPDKSFGLVLGNRKLQAHLYQEDKKPEQKPRHTAILLLKKGGGRFLKKEIIES